MNFVNNWLTQLTAEMAVDANTLPVTPEALALLPDGVYVLTLSGSLNPGEAAPVEIVAVQLAGGVATVTRGQEGTAALAWVVGAFVYCAVTAGTINKLVALLGSGGGAGGAIVSQVFYDFDLPVSLDQQSYTWSMSGGSSTPYTITLPPSPLNHGVRLEILLLNGSEQSVEASVSSDSAPFVNLAGGVMVADSMSFTQYDLLGTSGAWFVVNRLVYAVAVSGGGEAEPDPEQGPL